MATQLKLRRGTTAQHSTFTGASGEVTVDTDKKTVVVHDGAVAGGYPLLKAADIGTTVQGYDATTLKSANIGVTVQGYDATTLKSAAIGVTVQGYDVNTVKKNVANAYTAQQYGTEVTLTDAATVAWDVSAAQVAKVTLGGNRAFGAPTNMQAGAFYGLLVIQDATGSRVPSWNSVFKFPQAIAPTLTTTANAKDFFVFRSDGTNMYLVGKSLDVR